MRLPFDALFGDTGWAEDALAGGTSDETLTAFEEQAEAIGVAVLHTRFERSTATGAEALEALATTHGRDHWVQAALLHLQAAVAAWPELETAGIDAQEACPRERALLARERRVGQKDHWYRQYRRWLEVWRAGHVQTSAEADAARAACWAEWDARQVEREAVQSAMRELGWAQFGWLNLRVTGTLVSAAYMQADAEREAHERALARANENPRADPERDPAVRAHRYPRGYFGEHEVRERLAAA